MDNSDIFGLLHHTANFNGFESSTSMSQMAQAQSQDVTRIMKQLAQCPSAINPAIALYWELMQKQHSGTLTIEEVLLRQSEIERAQAEGQRQLDTVNLIQNKLNGVEPQPCNPLWVLV
jgi:uncharacterized protein YnzC (UPF0291/DUF896 family)